MPPSRLSKVVLPEPDGPMIATKSARGIVMSRCSKIEIFSLPLTKLFSTPERRIKVSDMASTSFALRPFFLCVLRRVAEGNLDRHIRKNAGVFLFETEANLDGRLFAIGGGHDGDH